MSEFYETRINGQIFFGHERQPMRCPNCFGTETLTVYGYRGGPARMKCTCGQEFAVPKPFDATALMEQVVTSPDRTTHTVINMPAPSHFRREF
jgi:hypothetical protein